MLKINYFCQVNCPFRIPLIKKIFSYFEKELKQKTKGEIEIIVVSDKEMKKLNYNFRGKNKTTDVLSFVFNEDKKIKSRYLGQIFISYPQIRKQAKQYGVSTKEEFIRMLVHGILHLAGFDHNTKIKEQKMFKLQEKIIEKII